MWNKKLLCDRDLSLHSLEARKVVFGNAKNRSKVDESCRRKNWPRMTINFPLLISKFPLLNRLIWKIPKAFFTYLFQKGIYMIYRCGAKFESLTAIWNLKYFVFFYFRTASDQNFQWEWCFWCSIIFIHILSAKWLVP